MILRRGNSPIYPEYRVTKYQSTFGHYAFVFAAPGESTSLVRTITEDKDVTVLADMFDQLEELRSSCSLFYVAAFDPCAWLKINNRMIYWPAHLLAD